MSAWMTIERAAEMVGCTENTVRAMVKEGRIEVKQVKWGWHAHKRGPKALARVKISQVKGAVKRVSKRMAKKGAVKRTFEQHPPRTRTLMPLSDLQRYLREAGQALLHAAANV